MIDVTNMKKGPLLGSDFIFDRLGSVFQCSFIEYLSCFLDMCI